MRITDAARSVYQVKKPIYAPDESKNINNRDGLTSRQKAATSLLGDKLMGDITGIEGRGILKAIFQFAIAPMMYSRVGNLIKYILPRSLTETSTFDYSI
jgi:hypothetical protein